MDSLKEICEGVLLRNIDEDNVLLYLGMAEQYSVARLKVGDALSTERDYMYLTVCKCFSLKFVPKISKFVFHEST